MSDRWFETDSSSAFHSTLRWLTTSKSRIEFQAFISDDPERRRPNISLARERLGWQPTAQRDSGLCKTIDYSPQP